MAGVVELCCHHKRSDSLKYPHQFLLTIFFSRFSRIRQCRDRHKEKTQRQVEYRAVCRGLIQQRWPPRLGEALLFCWCHRKGGTLMDTSVVGPALLGGLQPAQMMTLRDRPILNLPRELAIAPQIPDSRVTLRMTPAHRHTLNMAQTWLNCSPFYHKRTALIGQEVRSIPSDLRHSFKMHSALA